jgi:hypothetical protein
MRRNVSMTDSIINNKKLSQNLRSTIASFAIEGITPSKKALKYCKLRDAGKITCQQEVEALKKKYMEMARK